MIIVANYAILRSFLDNCSHLGYMKTSLRFVPVLKTLWDGNTLEMQETIFFQKTSEEKLTNICI